MKTNTTAHDFGNNESASTGIVPQSDGSVLALTFTESKAFKTEKGAAAWLAKRGYAPNGKRLPR